MVLHCRRLIMAPEDIRKMALADMITTKILRSKDYPGFLGSVQNAITHILIRGKQREI